MQKLIPIDLKGVIDNVKAEGKGRRVLWQDSESIAFLSSGRKERWDFHIDPADEVTLQLTGVQHLVYRDDQPAKNTPPTSKPAKSSSVPPACPTRRDSRRTPGSSSSSASVEPAKSITSSGSAISAARRFTKLPPKSAITVPILWGRSTKSSPAMKNCAPAKIAARWFRCRRSSGNELVPIVQTVPAVQTVSEPESEYLLARGKSVLWLRVCSLRKFFGVKSCESDKRGSAPATKRRRTRRVRKFDI